MKGFLHVFSVIALIAFCSCGGKQQGENDSPSRGLFAPEPEPRYAYGIKMDDYRIDTCRVQAGETLSGILSRHGLTSKQRSALQPFLNKHPELVAIREGGQYYTFRSDTALNYYAYRLNRRETIIASLIDSLYIWRDTLPMLTERRKAEFTIQSSLWQTIQKHNLPTELALE